MQTTLELITQKLNKLDSIPKKFISNVDKAQYEIYDKILSQFNKLSLDEMGNFIILISVEQLKTYQVAQ